MPPEHQHYPAAAPKLTGRRPQLDPGCLMPALAVPAGSKAPRCRDRARLLAHGQGADSLGPAPDTGHAAPAPVPDAPAPGHWWDRPQSVVNTALLAAAKRAVRQPGYTVRAGYRSAIALAASYSAPLQRLLPIAVRLDRPHWLV